MLSKPFGPHFDFVWVHYATWTIKTPMLLTVLGMLSNMHTAEIYMMVAFDLLMIASGYGAQLATSPEAIWVRARRAAPHRTASHRCMPDADARADAPPRARSCPASRPCPASAPPAAALHLRLRVPAARLRRAHDAPARHRH
jgi:hypothetical protein